MGEEEKKTEEKKAEEKKPEAKSEESKAEEKKEEKSEKPIEVKKAEEKKPEAKSEESKDSKEEAAAGTAPVASRPPPPPPPVTEIVLKVYMHCEGCARKVRRSLKGFEGVEDVITDCKSHKVIVKGEKADPLKVLDRVQRKSHRRVELLSPIPKPESEEEKKDKENQKPKPEEKKQEPQIISVVFKVHMHCEGCAQEIKKRIQKMKGVESAEPDLKSSQVMVKGVFDPPKLVEEIYKRTGKQAVIVKQEPAEKKEGEKAKEGESEKEKKGGEEQKKEKKDGDNNEAKPEGANEETKIVELKKNEYYYYPPRYGMELYAYPPQIFSDENPNACSVM